MNSLKSFTARSVGQVRRRTELREPPVWLLSDMFMKDSLRNDVAEVELSSMNLFMSTNSLERRGETTPERRLDGIVVDRRRGSAVPDRLPIRPAVLELRFGESGRIMLELRLGESGSGNEGIIPRERRGGDDIPMVLVVRVKFVDCGL